MKGSTKLLIVAAALLVAGILLSAIGYGLGAMTLTWGEDGLTIDPTQRAGIGLAALDLQEDILTSGAKTEIDIRLDGAVKELEVEGSVSSIEVQPGEDWSLEGVRPDGAAAVAVSIFRRQADSQLRPVQNQAGWQEPAGPHPSDLSANVAAG